MLTNIKKIIEENLKFCDVSKYASVLKTYFVEYLRKNIYSIVVWEYYQDLAKSGCKVAFTF